MEEIKAVFERERFRFDGSDTAISDAVLCSSEGSEPEYFQLKGSTQIDELSNGMTYLFYGHWTQYTNKRTDETTKQFVFKTFVESTPLDRNSMIAYLAKHGRGLGIGRGIARKIVEKFGLKAIEICRNEPEVVSTAFKISRENADQVGKLLRRNLDREETLIRLIGLLDRRGFPAKTPDRAFDTWGSIAYDTIVKDPFRLTQLKGCGFKLCDKFYLNLGLDPNRLKRQAHCLVQSLRTDNTGSTWFPIEVVTRNLETLVGSAAKPRRAVELAVRAKKLRLKKDDGRIWVAVRERADNESLIAEEVAKARKETTPWSESDSILSDTDASEHQSAEVAKIEDTAICSLGGGPGTGKTFTLALIVRSMMQRFGVNGVAVAAPTGKAAVRITEAMQAYGIKIRATTVHSLLGLGVNDGEFSYLYGKGNKLPYKFIAIDESSMLDTDLMAALIAARAQGTILLFVGDVNQLPPVGHGSPLLDMIAAKIPYAELTETRRNSGDIVGACTLVRQAKRFPFSETIDIENGRNLPLLRASNPADQIRKALQVCVMAKSQGLDPIWDVQVVCAVNQKSELGRKSLNRVLQSSLNPNFKPNKQPFFENDKVVNTKNGWYRLDSEFRNELHGVAAQSGPFGTMNYSMPDGVITVNEKGQVYVANGELAKVVEIKEKIFVFELNSPRRVIEVFRGKVEIDEEDDEDQSTGTGCFWDLGYALSCHKFQGSEVPIAVVMLDTYGGAKLIQTLEWFYTAASRGKRMTACVGLAETAYGMLNRRALGTRKTLLVETIREFELENQLLAIGGSLEKAEA